MAGILVVSYLGVSSGARSIHDTEQVVGSGRDGSKSEFGAAFDEIFVFEDFNAVWEEAARIGDGVQQDDALERGTCLGSRSELGEGGTTHNNGFEVGVVGDVLDGLGTWPRQR